MSNKRDPLYCQDALIRYEKGLPVLIPLFDGRPAPFSEIKSFDWPDAIHHSRCCTRHVRLRLKSGIWNLLFYDNNELIQGFAFKSNPRDEASFYQDLGLWSHDFTWLCCIVFARDFFQFGHIPQGLFDLFEDEILDD